MHSCSTVKMTPGFGKAEKQRTASLGAIKVLVAPGFSAPAGAEIEFVSDFSLQAEKNPYLSTR